MGDNVKLKRWLLVGLVVASAWVFFAVVVVPSIIEAAYRGESLAFLNAAISGQDRYPVARYLDQWKTATWGLIRLVLAVGFLPLPVLFLRRSRGTAVESEAKSGATISFVASKRWSWRRGLG